MNATQTNKPRLFTIDDGTLLTDLNSIVSMAHPRIALRGTATIREDGTDRVWTFGPEDRKNNGMTRALLAATCR